MLMNDKTARAQELEKDESGQMKTVDSYFLIANIFVHLLTHYAWAGSFQKQVLL